MKWQLGIPAAFLAALTVLQSVPARAETVSIDITATVDDVREEDNFLQGKVKVGDTIRGTYVYESTTPDSNDSPLYGVYEHSALPYGIDLSVNGLRFRTDPNYLDFSIGIVNDYVDILGRTNDNYGVSSSLNIIEGLASPFMGYFMIYFQLDDYTGTALSSDALPTMPPVLADYQSGNLLYIDPYVMGYTDFFIMGHITCAALSGSGGCGGGFSDADGDAVEDAIDTGPGSFADTNTPPTTGSIVDAGGLAVSVADAADPAQGVEITVGAGPGAGQASFSVCGFPVLLSPGSSTVITCGSIELIVNEGSAQILLDNDTVSVDIGAGGIAKITQNTDGTYTIENLGDNSAVTVTRNDAPVTINPGSSYVVGQLMTGYFSPVDMNGIFNAAKAGSAVPLKWLLTYVPEGTPVTDLASVTLRVQNLCCTSGSPTDQLEEVASDGSGLKNQGDGYYQLNWKTLKSYAGTCKSLVLDFGGGNTAPPALFSFK
jgi:hypothetical protein